MMMLFVLRMIAAVGAGLAVWFFAMGAFPSAAIATFSAVLAGLASLEGRS